MKLLLTSQGLSNQKIKQAFLDNLPKNPEDIKVAFVTTAAFGETEDPFWLEDAREELRDCGIKHIKDLDLKGKRKEELKQILSDKNVLFVNGGNTFYLLKYLRESGLQEFLPKLLDRGLLYVGISAGSIIAGPSVEVAGWKNLDKNKVKLRDLTGLHLVPFSLFVHYTKKYKTLVEEKIKYVEHPLIVLTDQQAVLCISNQYRIVGEGERLVYNGTIKNLAL